MTSISPAIAPDSFTWSRVGAIMKLIYPRLKSTLIVFLVVGITASLIVYGISFLPAFLTLTSFVVFIPSILYLINPVFVVNSVSADQLTMLPARASEKMMALILYCLLICPVLVYYIPQLTMTFLILHSDINTPDVSMAFDYLRSMNPLLFSISYFSAALPCSVCLYTAVRFPKNKWKPILMGILVLFSTAFIGGVYGGILAFRAGFENGMAGRPIKDFDPDQFTMSIIDDLQPLMWVVAIASLFLVALFLWLTYRKLANRQL